MGIIWTLRLPGIVLSLLNSYILIWLYQTQKNCGDDDKILWKIGDVPKMVIFFKEIVNIEIEPNADMTTKKDALGNNLRYGWTQRIRRNIFVLSFIRNMNWTLLIVTHIIVYFLDNWHIALFSLPFVIINMCLSLL